MQLSLVIPAYNERARLPGTLALIHVYFHNADCCKLLEVLVVDDGSIDGTAALAEEWGNRLPIRCIRLPRNSGKGAASRMGALEAKGDYILLYDADSATPIREVATLLRVLREQNADIAIGSRVLGRAERTVKMGLHRRIVGRVYHFLSAPLTPGIADAACGCKLFCREAAHDVFARQRLNRFAFDVEILSIAHSRGYRIVEIPVHWVAVSESKVRLLRDGCEMFCRVLGLYRRKYCTRKQGFTNSYR